MESKNCKQINRNNIQIEIYIYKLYYILTKQPCVIAINIKLTENMIVSSYFIQIANQAQGAQFMTLRPNFEDKFFDFSKFNKLMRTLHDRQGHVDN